MTFQRVCPLCQIRPMLYTLLILCFLPTSFTRYFCSNITVGHVNYSTMYTKKPKPKDGGTYRSWQAAPAATQVFTDPIPEQYGIGEANLPSPPGNMPRQAHIRPENHTKPEENQRRWHIQELVKPRLRRPGYY